MGEWPTEMFKRLPLLYNEAIKYLGVGADDLEVLFVAHGDAYTDADPIQVAEFGKGKVLDGHIASFARCSGGGQGHETHELVAYYLANRVDTSSARNVFVFFVTDESAYDAVDPRHVSDHLGVSATGALGTASLFAELARRMHLHVILRRTDSYKPEPILNWWKATVGEEHVLQLSDARRVVDVILGTMASLLGQRERFESDLNTRLLPTAYGKQNIATVMGSIALVGRGTSSSPFRLPDGATQGNPDLLGGPDDGGPKRLPPPDGGTRSLLDD
jgi:hypothetical protein